LTDMIGAMPFQTSLMVRILLLTTLIFFAPSCLLGMISPVVVKLTLSSLTKTGNVVGKIYAFSTLGSIIGTFLTGFYLISWMGTRMILYSTAVILMASALLFSGFLARKKYAVTAVVSVAIAALAFGVVSGHAVRPPSAAASIYWNESDYYTIRIAKHKARYDGHEVKALVLDHLIHSINDVNDPLYLDYEYLRMYEEFIRWRLAGNGDFRSLFIGGGGYTFPRYLEVKYPQAQIDVVEIDPEVTRVVHSHLGLPETTRIHSFDGDARWFVMNSRDQGRYDFIFGDAFNDLSVPYHLTTREFTAQLAGLLKPDGVLLANLIDSFDRGAFLPAYVRTLEAVFGEGNVHVLSRTANYRGAGIATFIIVASRTPLDPARFVEAIKKESPNPMSYAVPPDALRRFLRERPAIILTDDYAPVDNLTAPIFEERFGYKRK
jgi:spermidine synthase